MQNVPTLRLNVLESPKPVVFASKASIIWFRSFQSENSEKRKREEKKIVYQKGPKRIPTDPFPKFENSDDAASLVIFPSRFSVSFLEFLYFQKHAIFINHAVLPILKPRKVRKEQNAFSTSS